MSGVSGSPRPTAPWAVQTISVIAFLVLYIPLVTIVVYSFLVPVDGLGSPKVFGWQWYLRVFENRQLLESLWMSITVALCSALMATLLGTIAALSLERGRFPGRKLLDGIAMVPLIMPELVLGLSLLMWFVMLRLVLGWFSIVLAHITFCMSYVIVTVRSRLQDFDHSLEEAAYDLGATPWESFWRVTFPLIRPGIFAGGLMAFTLSFDDFIITFFTTGVGSDTLPLKLYSMIKLGINPEVYALSSIVLVITFVAIFWISKHGDGLTRRRK